MHKFVEEKKKRVKKNTLRMNNHGQFFDFFFLNKMIMCVDSRQLNKLKIKL